MEAYPEDLLVGVSPLVFAVNGIFTPAPELVGTETGAAISTKHRTLFDRFLDAMAASLLDENESDDDDKQEFRNLPSRVSLFRPDEDDMDGSSDEDVLLPAEIDEDDVVMKKNSFLPAAPAFGSMSFRLRSNNSNSHLGSHVGSENSRSYAKALKHGQGFFQRARIVSISAKHGFPPSKDPEGKQNQVYAIHKAKTSLPKLKALFSSKPLQGIISSGWLQKHVHALPSALLVVVQLSDENQDAQNSFLLKTLEHLFYSLVPKRECQIHIICLVADTISALQAEQWSLEINRQILEENKPQPIRHEPQQITLLRISRDLHSNSDGFPTSGALRKLHRAIRETSFNYYVRQVRWTKKKLIKLLSGRRKSRKRFYPKEILPFCIRYCFKIAIFYEFQWKHEQSLKFLAEAYRHVRTYYRFLQSTIKNEDDEEDGRNNKQISAPTILPSNVSFSTAKTSDMEEGTEVSVDQSVASSSDDSVWPKAVPLPPEDMVYQCRAVADWLNFKLLQAGFVSSTEGGVLAASEQWRRHCLVFLSKKYFFASEEWYYWCQVSHERLVMSQLVERNPPKSLGGFGNDYDEVLFRCSPWRSYQSVTEALLKTGVEVQRALAKKMQGWTENLEADEMRPPYVGGLDSSGLSKMLEEQSRINHRAKALEFALRAVSLYEQEYEQLRDARLNMFYPLANRRSGGRLYYLVGGMLVGANRHKDATPYLEHAEKLCKDWSGLQLAVRRLLVDCYEKNVTPQSESRESSEAIASTVFDSCFNSNTSTENLQRAIANYALISGSDNLKWNRTCTDEADSTLPFTFSVTFPGTTHATAGDTVNASLVMKSNLDYAVHIDSLTLLSFAGPIEIPPEDLINAQNAKTGKHGGLFVEAKSEFFVTTQIELPKDLNDIVIDESGNAVDRKGTPGKGSFTKSARPRTAGVSSAAGARFLSEDVVNKPKNTSAQWSLGFLGGKSLRCDGIRFVLYTLLEGNTAAPDNAAKANAIEVTIEKKKYKAIVDTKRTPFEEDNYISSAWHRPLYLPLAKGPRCLRVLGPMSEMEITNLTLPKTGDTALEGTVNRVLLKLEAGATEICKDINYQVKCSSMLVTMDGKTVHLTEEESPKMERGMTLHAKNPATRTPLLVTKDRNSTESQQTDYGFAIPSGWSLAGPGFNTSDVMVPKISTLKGGESTFVFFDLYRPSPLSTRRQGFLGGVEQDFGEHSLCQTDFEVTITYHQERPPWQKQKRINLEARRRPLAEETKDSGAVVDLVGENDPADMVTLNYSGSLMWSVPLAASFSRGLKSGFPSGSRHHTNSTLQPSNDYTEVPVINGERINTRCVLQGNENITTEIVKIRFEDNPDLESPCSLALVSGLNSVSGEKVIYESSKGDSCRLLTSGSKFSFAYSGEATMRGSPPVSSKSYTLPLGVVAIDWLPPSLDIAQEARAEHEIDGHGPLVLSTPLTMRFLGPSACIENAPFEVQFKCLPSAPKVGVPFEVSYAIRNKTQFHQILAVILDENSGSTSEDILICGLVKGEISLSPSEKQTFSYTALATRSGRTFLPSLSISSTRYNSWVVNEAAENARPLFVLP